MILQNNVREVISTGVEETNRMSISDDVQSHIIRIVTENSYKDALGSGIREAVSNSLDSMTESGNSDPVIVSLQKNENGKWEFSTQDTGLGLDDVEFQKYIMGIGESTKRLSASLLGGYGLGSKAFLSYADSYTYLCRKNGVERKYLIFKGAEFPESMLIYEKETSEPNGVTVSVELNDGWYESENCIKAIKTQLAYLPNVYFNVRGIDNKYKIFQNNLFQWNTLNPLNEMHISLKNIYYPIAWKELGLNPINLPVALRFDNYDDLQPIFNREELKWTEHSKNAVKEKIKEVCDWFINKYNESVSLIKKENIKKEWDKLNPKCAKYVEIEGEKFNISNLEQWASVKFASPAIDGINILPTSLLYEKSYWILSHKYKICAEISDGVFRTKSVDGFQVSINTWLNPRTWIVKCEETPKGNHRLFLKDEFDNAVFVKEEGYNVTLKGQPSRWEKFGTGSYAHILNLSKIPKNQWREAIKEWQYIESVFEEKVVDISSYPITEEWMEERKKMYKKGVRGERATKEEVKPTQIVYDNHWKNKGNFKGVEIGLVPITSLTGYYSLNIYAERGNIDDRIYSLVEIPGINLFIFNKTDFKKVNNAGYYSWITFEEFIKGETNKFRKLCIRQKAYNMYNFLNESSFILSVDREKKHLRNMIGDFRKKDKVEIPNWMMKIAEENNFWNHPIVSIFEKAEKRKSKVDMSFLEHISLYTKEAKALAMEIYMNRLRKVKQNERNIRIPEESIPL